MNVQDCWQNQGCGGDLKKNIYIYKKKIIFIRGLLSRFCKKSICQPVFSCEKKIHTRYIKVSALFSYYTKALGYIQHSVCLLLTYHLLSTVNIVIITTIQNRIVSIYGVSHTMFRITITVNPFRLLYFNFIMKEV